MSAAFFRALLLPVFLLAPLAHAATIAGSEASASGPSPVTLTFTLSSAPGEAVAGVQFEISFDPARLTLQGMEAGDSARTAGKLLSTNPVGPGRHRVIIAGLNQTAIADGPILLASVSASGNVPPGRYPVAIENAVLSDPSGHKVPVHATPAVMIIGDGGGAAPLPAPPASGGCGCSPALAAGPAWPGYALTLALSLLAASRTFSRPREKTSRH